MEIWLKHGDRNTKFFHGKEDQRRKTNIIKKLKDENGCWWRGDIHYERLLLNYFSNLFFLYIPINIHDVCSLVQTKSIAH